MLEGHPEMGTGDMEDAVRTTVRQAERITDDAKKGHFAYYRAAPWPYKVGFLVKVAGKQTRHSVIMKTAYVVTDVPPKEVVLWVKEEGK